MDVVYCWSDRVLADVDWPTKQVPTGHFCVVQLLQHYGAASVVAGLTELHLLSFTAGQAGEPNFKFGPCTA